MWIAIIITIFALAGAPVFAVMGGSTALAWLTHDTQDLRYLRFLAPDVLADQFAASPILVTVPLFTFIGYVLAESKAPERIVRAADAFFGWLPGGLAIVCIIASAFFTTLTGGSAVTIVAVGALLLPTLLKHGYPQDYALGLVMTGGSLGMLLPPSLPILIYALVAGIDFNMAFKASTLPGILVVGILAVHAAYIGVKYKIPLSTPRLSEMRGAFWVIKWELGVPVLILGTLATGLCDIDECGAIAALYVLGVEFFIHKDLKIKDIPRLASNAIALAGALLLIMAFSMSLTNYIIAEQLPQKLYEAMTAAGVKERWHFLVMLNLFLYIEGTVLDGFSIILVTVPLLVPFAAQFGINPFHMMAMFLLNMEIAYLSPPLGQNLFVTSFRFSKSMISLFRISLPFLGLLSLGLVIIMFVPKLSTVAIDGDIAEAKARAEKFGEPPRDAWLMECVQEDRNNPLPCTDADKAKWLDSYGQVRAPGEEDPAPGEADGTEESEDERLLRELSGEGTSEEDSLDTGDDEEGSKAAPAPTDDGDDALNELMGDDEKAANGSGAPDGDEAAQKAAVKNPKPKAGTR